MTSGSANTTSASSSTGKTTYEGGTADLATLTAPTNGPTVEAITKMTEVLESLREDLSGIEPTTCRAYGGGKCLMR
jgi:hypothetical protein